MMRIFPFLSIAFAMSLTFGSGSREIIFTSLDESQVNISSDAGEQIGDLRFQLRPLEALGSGEGFSGFVQVANFSNETTEIVLEYNLQRNSEFYDQRPPHSSLGKDEALRKVSWTERLGERVSEGSLTDGKESAGYDFLWGSDVIEADQVIDLGEVMEVMQFSKRLRDANWIFKVDVLSSLDGKHYEPVPGMQGLNWKGEFGRRMIEVPAPFKARFVKFHYHNDGAVMNSLLLPTVISVYNGSRDDAFFFPVIGDIIDSGKERVVIPAHSVAVIPMAVNVKLETGCYLFSVRYAGDSPDARWISWDDILVLPPTMKTVSEGSAFGINGATPSMADRNRELGVGWVRFENLKWPMVSPAPNVFLYDGSVGPWHMNVDAYLKKYHELGIAVLPYLFQVPLYESKVPAGVTENPYQYPPKDLSQYGKFVFQTVARYGSKKHPDSVLLTDDKISGLGWVNTFELWNEPDLSNPSWGHFVGPYNDYLDMFRIGAEAVKRADSEAKVSNGGLAGIQLSMVDQFRSYTYPDGKRPLDFMDVLSVHHYTGSVAPEISTVNTNIDRSGNTSGKKTFEGHLLELDAWRDRYKPEMAIWMTETGYDTGGVNEISVRKQAAWTPRNVMMILSSGIDKVLVYRESGSTPSLYAASGMLDNDAKPRASFLTYATLIRVMEGAHSFARLPHENANVRLYGAVKNGTPVIAAWAIEGREVLGLDFGEVKLTDAFGFSRNQVVGESFELSEFPVYVEDLNLDVSRALFIAARSEAKAKRTAAERLTKLKTYLFDFGEQGTGVMNLGGIRPYIEVGPDALFAQNEQYGFVETSSERNYIDHHWIRDPISRDGLKVPSDTAFRINVEPGCYRFSASVKPLSDDARVVLKGAESGELELIASNERTAIEVELLVGTSPIDIVTHGYSNIHWISMIEIDPS